MPNWKKLIVSGSDATLNSLEVGSATISSGAMTGSFTGSYSGDGSSLTGISAGSPPFFGNFQDITSNITIPIAYYSKMFGPLTVNAEIIVGAGSILVIEDLE
jgi:hypothetical protein|tara:strand:+ start:28 stop:333 length:306 start_codon:yes stop_codon:yes gene_type:complete